MARQGLMDDSGYDFFDAGDCANYESCREEAYNDGYQQGATDMEKAKQIIIDSLLKQLEVVKADAIKEVECEVYHQAFNIDHEQDGLQKWDGGNWIRYELFENVIEKLKEQIK